MNLVKTSILSFIATVIKMLSMLVINKAVALLVGPSGIALIGQFQNFTQLSMTAAQGGVNQGVTKYTAEYGKESERLPALFSTAAKVSLVCSSVVGLICIILSTRASEYLLNTPQYAYVFIVFGIGLPLFVLNQLLLSIVNGLKEVKTFIGANISQSIYSLIFTTTFVVFFGLHGALIAIVTNQAVVLLVVLWMLRKHAIIRLAVFRDQFSRAEAKKLLGYSAMALTTAATAPVSHLIIRNHLGETLGWDQAGYWQAIWYISTMYLTVATTALSIYYLPKLSEITEKTLLRKELANGYKLIIPTVALMAITIFTLKDFVIWLLFTPDFEPMRKLFAWQLVGDVIKITAWLLSFVMLAKAMVKPFIITQVVFHANFTFLAILLSSKYGLIGMTYAHTINFTCYLLVIFFVVRKEIFN
jgi:PST family polysaccharide transporter